MRTDTHFMKVSWKSGGAHLKAAAHYSHPDTG